LDQIYALSQTLIDNDCKYEICLKYVRDIDVMNSEGRNKQTHDKMSVTSPSEQKMCELFNPDPGYYTNERNGRCLLLPKIRADISDKLEWLVYVGYIQNTSVFM
jgi:hypothetical protein